MEQEGEFERIKIGQVIVILNWSKIVCTFLLYLHAIVCMWAWGHLLEAKINIYGQKTGHAANFDLP